MVWQKLRSDWNHKNFLRLLRKATATRISKRRLDEKGDLTQSPTPMPNFAFNHGQVILHPALTPLALLYCKSPQQGCRHEKSLNEEPSRRGKPRGNCLNEETVSTREVIGKMVSPAGLRQISRATEVLLGSVWAFQRWNFLEEGLKASEDALTEDVCSNHVTGKKIWILIISLKIKYDFISTHVIQLLLGLPINLTCVTCTKLRQKAQSPGIHTVRRTGTVNIGNFDYFFFNF